MNRIAFLLSSVIVLGGCATMDTEALLRAGNAGYEDGDYAGAVAVYTRILEKNPRHFEARNNRGLSRHRLGDERGALEDYHACLLESPTFAEAYYNRGIVMAALGHYDRAIEDFTLAIRYRPRYPLAYAARGHARIESGDWAGAVQDLEEALTRASQNWEERAAVESELARAKAAANSDLETKPREEK